MYPKRGIIQVCKSPTHQMLQKMTIWATGLTLLDGPSFPLFGFHGLRQQTAAAVKWVHHDRGSLKKWIENGRIIYSRFFGSMTFLGYSYMCDLFTAHNGLHMGISKGHEWNKLVDGGRIWSKFWKTHVENTSDKTNESNTSTVSGQIRPPWTVTSNSCDLKFWRLTTQRNWRLIFLLHFNEQAVESGCLTQAGKFPLQAKHVSWPPLKHHEAKTLSSMQSLSRIETPILKRNMTCQTFSWCSSGNQARQFQKCRFLPTKIHKIPSVFVEHQSHQSPTAKKETWENNSNLLKLIPVKPTQMFSLFKSNKPQPNPQQGSLYYQPRANPSKITIHLLLIWSPVLLNDPNP